jgi:hypothetical protein
MGGFLKKSNKLAPPDALVVATTPMKTKTQLCSHFAVALAASLLLSNASNAATIAVTSGSFENPDSTFASTNWANLDLAWNNGPAPTELIYEQNSGDNIAADTGNWSALLGGRPQLSQDLLTTVNAGDTLSLTFRGGKGSFVGSAGGGTFAATFNVGGTLYTTSFDTTTNATTWETFTLVHTITNTGNLSIAFDDVSGNPWLDTIGNVNTQAIPEPSALVLLSLGWTRLASPSPRIIYSADLIPRSRPTKGGFSRLREAHQKPYTLRQRHCATTIVHIPDDH